MFFDSQKPIITRVIREKCPFPPYIGYHYTSYDNWLKIKYEGLVPYNIDYKTSELTDIRGIKGIFVFEEKLEGLSHFGTVIFHCGAKNVTKIVQLKVIYNYILCFKTDKDDDIIRLPHIGGIGKLIYHTGEYLHIISDSVKPKDIELIGIYDLEKAFQTSDVIENEELLENVG